MTTGPSPAWVVYRVCSLQQCSLAGWKFQHARMPSPLAEVKYNRNTKYKATGKDTFSNTSVWNSVSFQDRQNIKPCRTDRRASVDMSSLEVIIVLLSFALSCDLQDKTYHSVKIIDLIYLQLISSRHTADIVVHLVTPVTPRQAPTYVIDLERFPYGMCTPQ